MQRALKKTRLRLECDLGTWSCSYFQRFLRGVGLAPSIENVIHPKNAQEGLVNSQKKCLSGSLPRHLFAQSFFYLGFSVMITVLRLFTMFFVTMVDERMNVR